MSGQSESMSTISSSIELVQLSRLITMAPRFYPSMEVQVCLTSFALPLADYLLKAMLGVGQNANSSHIQIGFPKLPDVGSPTHFELILQWLQDCDENHACHPKRQGSLPTRLIDVGERKDPKTLRLHHTMQGDVGQYTALSHRWGNPEEHRKFCTYRSTIEEFKQNIDYDDLPRTFQDAVTTARKLGIRYIWIDSLCIIQDDPADWEAESKRMEDVFSSAYCTIVASCAKGTTDGFLKSRPTRQYVTVNIDREAPLYICEAIDDFHHDVEEGELNKRGWVLQERALSHRSIYFTENQSYWECGEGVRCETLTKMRK